MGDLTVSAHSSGRGARCTITPAHGAYKYEATLSDQVSEQAHAESGGGCWGVVPKSDAVEPPTLPSSGNEPKGSCTTRVWL